MRSPKLFWRTAEHVATRCGDCRCGSLRRHLEGKTADLTNAPDLMFAGAIIAALFLSEFVEPRCPWAHLDVMAWNTETRPGRLEGGEAMGMWALYRMLEERFPRPFGKK